MSICKTEETICALFGTECLSLDELFMYNSIRMMMLFAILHEDGFSINFIANHYHRKRNTIVVCLYDFYKFIHENNPMYQKYKKAGGKTTII